MDHHLHRLDTLRALGPTSDVHAVKALYADAPADPGDGDGAVHCDTDLPYGPHARHRLDVYRPGDPGAAPRAVLLVFHGGGFIGGDKSQRRNVGAFFAREGFVTVLANYRLAPESRWPSGAEDVVAATAWVRREIHRFGGDADRTVLFGESAGAAHVAAAVLVRRFQPAGGLGVAGAVLVSGPYHPQLEGQARAAFGIPTPDPRNDAYFGTDASLWHGMSVAEQVSAEPLPLLITFAEMDLLQMQVQAGVLFARLVGTHGFQPALQVIRHHNHFSQILALGTGDRWLADPVLAFVRAVLRDPRAPSTPAWPAPRG
jgi:acetyl esterase